MLKPLSHPILRLSDLGAPGDPGSRWSALTARETVLYAYSARAALYQLFKHIANPARRTVLVPAFHCPTIVEAALRSGYDVRFYRIEADLRIAQADLLRKLDDTVAATVFIRYFGFKEEVPELFAACRSAGALIIDDCSHSFLETQPLRLASRGDVALYSFWKLIPSAEGGGMSFHNPAIPSTWPQRHPTWQDSYAKVRLLFSQLLESRQRQRQKMPGAMNAGAPLQEQPAIRRSAAEQYPFDEVASTATIPAYARFILQRANLAAIATARRRNYQLMAERLLAHSSVRPLFAQLPPDVCPWAFPVTIARRREVDYRLRARGVALFTFGEVLHPALDACERSEPAMVAAARLLSDSVLCLSIHQQLERDEIVATAQIIEQFFATSPAAIKAAV